MKKLFLSAAIIGFAFTASAQTLKEVGNMVILRQYEKAKPAIDKLLADPKTANNAEAWYYKGTVYNMLSLDSTISASTSLQLKNDSYAAYLKAQQLDPKDKWLKDDGYMPYLYLYSGLFDVAIKHFNAKDYEGAYNSFAKALEVQQYITGKGYTYKDVVLTKFDTSLVLNTAIAAMQAKKTAEGNQLYQSMVDNDVQGPNYEDVYLYLADVYTKDAADAGKLDALLAKARKFYPTNPFWSQVVLDKIKNSGDKQALINKYEELTANGQDFQTQFNYGVELFNMKYGSDAEAVKLVSDEKLDAVISKAISMDKEISASILMANHRYNQVYDANEKLIAIKGTTPAAVKSKNDQKVKMLKMVDVALPASKAVVDYMDKLSTLTSSQVIHYNNQLDHIVEYYKLKGDAASAAKFAAKKKK